MASPSKSQKMKPKGRRTNQADKGPTKAISGAGVDQDQLDDPELEEALNIRVKERDPDDPPGSRMGRPSNKRLGQLFRDPSPAGIKESIKRPLSGLFRRPGSRSGSRSKTQKGEGDGANEDAASDAEGNGHVQLDDEQDEEQAWNSKHGSSDAKPGLLRNTRKRFSIPKLGSLMSGGGGGDDDKHKHGGGGKTAVTNMDDATTELGPDALDSHATGAGAGRRGGSVSETRLLDDNDNRASTPEIPTLEEPEMMDEFGGDQVAKAPNVAVNRVSSYRELDNALMKHAAFSSLEDIDLSLLTRFLCPEHEVKDEEVPWSWDYLYTSVCTELREDWLIDQQEIEEQEENRTGDDRRPLTTI